MRMVKPPELVRMPNERRDVALRVENVLPIPPCCPVSGNPLAGSTLTIRYRPVEWVLEVYALKQYVQLFAGGHPDGTRNMEQMVAKIAADCAAVLEVPVFVYAHLLLHPDQQMFVRATGRPSCPSIFTSEGMLSPFREGALTLPAGECLVPPSALKAASRRRRSG